MNCHIKTCKTCQAVIARVVQRELEAMDVDDEEYEDDPVLDLDDDTADTVEDTVEEEDPAEPNSQK